MDNGTEKGGMTRAGPPPVGRFVQSGSTAFFPVPVLRTSTSGRTILFISVTFLIYGAPCIWLDSKIPMKPYNSPIGKFGGARNMTRTKTVDKEAGQPPLPASDGVATFGSYLECSSESSFVPWATILLRGIRRTRCLLKIL